MSETHSDHCWISLRHSDADDDAEHDLDSYLGHLYDDMESKVRASHMIFVMSLDIDRLGAMAFHGSAMGALARVLKEEGKKSFELRINMISTFLIFSFFKPFHQILIENQIGRATLSLLDFETIRMSIPPLKSQTRTDQVLDDSHGAHDRKAIPPSLFLNRPSLHEQEKIICMAICLLYNVAEDHQIEKKMRKFNLVECLCEALHRTNTYLLFMTVTFLKRLSVYIDNLNAMRENTLVFKLLHVLQAEDELLLCGTLRLLWNLSFDRGFREEMIDCGFLQSFETLLQKKKFEHLVFGVLYNLSRDLDLRLKITESRIPSILIEPILSEHDISMAQELSALLINLTCIPKTAMLNLNASEVEKFVAFVLRTNDVLLFKAVKHLSFLQGTGVQLIPFVPALIACLLRCEPCIQVEVMEMINNLTCMGELRNSLLLDTGLLHYVLAHLHVANMEDDINLQIIMFIGGVCSATSASTISQAGLVDNLCDVFVSRGDDVDIALQSLFAMNNFLMFESTREAFCRLFDKDSEKSVTVMADHVIDAISEVDELRGHQLRSMRFNMYNGGWSAAPEVLFGF